MLKNITFNVPFAVERSLHAPGVGILKSVGYGKRVQLYLGGKKGTTRATCIIIAITTESLLRVHLRKQEKGNKGS